MVLIFTKDGKSKIVNQKEIQNEDYLQEYIKANPEIIPFYEIEEGKKVLVIVREFSTPSGPVDAVGVDGEGYIYLIETKLEKNADKRRVIAQILDYAASMWKNIDYDGFIEVVDNYLMKEKGIDFESEVKKYFELDDIGRITQNIKSNITEGSFRLVIVMDSIDDALKNLITYINMNSYFEFYGIELDYYEHAGFRIVSPHIIGTEIPKKDQVKTERTVSPAITNFILKVKEKVLKEYPDFNSSKNPKNWLDFGQFDWQIKYAVGISYPDLLISTNFVNSLKDDELRKSLTEKVGEIRDEIKAKVGEFRWTPNYRSIIIVYDQIDDEKELDDVKASEIAGKISSLYKKLNPIVSSYAKELESSTK